MPRLHFYSVSATVKNDSLSSERCRLPLEQSAGRLGSSVRSILALNALFEAGQALSHSPSCAPAIVDLLTSCSQVIVDVLR